MAGAGTGAVAAGGPGGAGLPDRLDRGSSGQDPSALFSSEGAAFLSLAVCLLSLLRAAASSFLPQYPQRSAASATSLEQCGQ